MHVHIHHAYTCMHTYKCISPLTHTQTHINELPNIYNIAIIHVNKANLEASCGAPMEAPTEASGVAEGVVG